jgi:hypothetical protein
LQFRKGLNGIKLEMGDVVTAPSASGPRRPRGFPTLLRHTDASVSSRWTTRVVENSEGRRPMRRAQGGHGPTGTALGPCVARRRRHTSCPTMNASIQVALSTRWFLPEPPLSLRPSSRSHPKQSRHTPCSAARRSPWPPLPSSFFTRFLLPSSSSALPCSSTNSATQPPGRLTAPSPTRPNRGGLPATLPPLPPVGHVFPPSNPQNEIVVSLLSIPTTSPVHPDDELAGFWISPSLAAARDYIARSEVFLGAGTQNPGTCS